MKKAAALLTSGLFTLFANAQIGNLTLSEFVPESQSVTEAVLKDPNFNNSYVYIMAHGLTVFNQSREIILLDSKTLQEKKKIDFPKYKGYDKLDVFYNIDLGWEDNTFDMDKNLFLFFSNKADKALAISAVKINENLTVPVKPDYLFSMPEKFNVRFYRNEKKDLCVFTFEVENKKEKKNYFHYRVFDNDLKMLKADSVAYEYKGTNNCSALVYDKGCALIKNNGTQCEIIYTDLSTKKTGNFTLAHAQNTITVESIKSITGDKLVFAGKYSILNDKRYKNGLFKATVNSKTNAVEEQVYFDHIVAGEAEKEKRDKNIEKLIITDAGACYFLISQGPVPSYSEYEMGNKYEIVYINSASDKWKKQIPLVAKATFDMLYANNNLFITYLDYEGDNNKIDANNYIYGKPNPSNPVTLRQVYKSNIALMKVTPNGTITRQTFIDNFYRNVLSSKGEFIGVHQGLNGQVTSKCRLLKITDLK